MASEQGGATRGNYLIRNGAVITVDPKRQVIENGAIAVQGDRIVAVGPRADVELRYNGERNIDASQKVALPGLIDSHGHAGHGMTRALGAGARLVRCTRRCLHRRRSERTGARVGGTPNRAHPTRCC